jgi:protoporphyrinogen/coproporphyrinogen III oxidase
LQEIIPDARRRYLGCRVLRTPVAYPVYLNAYEEVRLKLEHSLGVEGLYTIGRNGEFSHALMEDVYWKTQDKMRDMLLCHPELLGSSYQWNSNKSAA